MPIVARAGAAIMRVYGGLNMAVQRKEDDSPLTLADLESQRVILEGLAQITPDIPVLSEESAQAPWSERRAWDELWVVDPLDGTREFVKRNGEFTVNIALVQEHEPVLGVVAAPALGLMYWGASGVGAFSQHGTAARLKISVSAPQNPVRVVGSRSHLSAATAGYLAKLGQFAEMLFDRRRQGRPLSALRPHLGVGYRRGPGRARSGGRPGHPLGRPSAALQLPRQPDQRRFSGVQSPERAAG